MNVEDYLISIALLALVVRQIRGKKITLFGLLWPLAIVLYAGYKYLDGVPTNDNNLRLIIACMVVGAVLGVGCGLLTKVFQKKDTVVAKATGGAVILWVVGIGARLAFGLYAENGGDGHIVNFSTGHGLNPQVWAPALVLMSLIEVIGRTIPLAYRARQLQRQAQ